MLKPHHKQSNLLMEVAGRHQGRRSVNRRYCPPLETYSILIKRGHLKTERVGTSRSRTTFVVLTQKGIEEVASLKRHYNTEIAPEVLEAIAA